MAGRARRIALCPDVTAAGSSALAEAPGTAVQFGGLGDRRGPLPLDRLHRPRAV